LSGVSFNNLKGTMTFDEDYIDVGFFLGVIPAQQY